MPAPGCTRSSALARACAASRSPAFTIATSLPGVKMASQTRTGPKRMTALEGLPPTVPSVEPSSRTSMRELS